MPPTSITPDPGSVCRPNSPLTPTTPLPQLETEGHDVRHSEVPLYDLHNREARGRPASGNGAPSYGRRIRRFIPCGAPPPPTTLLRLPSQTCHPLQLVPESSEAVNALDVRSGICVSPDGYRAWGGNNSRLRPSCKGQHVAPDFCLWITHMSHVSRVVAKYAFSDYVPGVRNESQRFPHMCRSFVVM